MKLDFPKDFLQEELRCDYLVTEEMKRVWAASMDLYAVLDEVCRAHGLRYFFGCGNLLGAARHQGFIPWDDDIDIIMPREDYEKLCAIAGDAFQPPYFFQTDHTDPGSHIAFAKLRNSETSAILDFEKPYRFSYNQGMFLDIFPLDNLPDAPREREAFAKKIVRLKKWTGKWSRIFCSGKIYFNRSWMYLSMILFILPRLLVRGLKIPNIPCRMLEKEMQRYNDRVTQCMSTMALGDVKAYPRECFEETVMLPFEFIRVPAPAGYVTYLDCEYGDWHKFVRGPEGGSMHEGIRYDTKHSYRNYL